MRRGVGPSAVAYALAAAALIALGYGLPRLLPGDFVSASWSEAPVVLTAEQETALRAAYGGEGGFLAYLAGLAKGAWGTSWALRAPVLALIWEALPWTLLLVGSAHLLATGAGFVGGVEAAWRRGSPLEKAAVAAMTVLEGVPELSGGVLLLLIFALKLQWFPAAGGLTPYAGYSGIRWVLDLLSHLALPLATLFLAYLPGNFLLARASMVLVLRAAYVETARAKGLPPLRIRYAHAARNALLPVVTRFGMRIAFLVTGALVVETLYAYPGLGTLLFQAIARRDLPLIQGVVLFSSLAVLSVNLVLDLVYRRLDPGVLHAR